MVLINISSHRLCRQTRYIMLLGCQHGVKHSSVVATLAIKNQGAQLSFSVWVEETEETKFANNLNLTQSSRGAIPAIQTL